MALVRRRPFESIAQQSIIDRLRKGQPELLSVSRRAHVRYKPTFLKDSGSGDFCDPFGFCQGVLQQLEFAGAVVVRF